MAEITKQALQVSNNTSFPNNNAGAITPSDLRAFNVNMIDSLVDEIGYNADSASWNRSINALNTFTSSQQPSFTALNAFTASQLNINSGVNLFTQSADGRLDILEDEVANIEAFTASINEIRDDGVLQGYSTRFFFNGLVSASIVQNVGGAIANVTVEQDGTKLNTASFNAYTASTNLDLDAIHQATASLQLFTASFNSSTFVGTASFNAYTASNNQRVTSLEANSASVNVSITNLNSTTSSFATSITNLNSATQSLQSQLATIGGQSGSWITESETGSFARYDVSNPWSANQTFTNITATSASFQYLTTIYETASVIFSSGSNQLGDELTDIQTLSGSVKIQGGLTINGLDVTGSLNSLNASSASQQVSIDALNTNSASVNISITNVNSATASLFTSVNNLNASSASQQISIDALNVYTASQSTASIVTSITELNTFSASALVSINNINSTTASLNTSVSNLNQATASLFGSASLGLTTASFDNGTRNLTFTKGDNQTFSVNIPDVSGSTGNFATTGSNTFTGTQTINADLYVSGNTDLGFVNIRDLGGINLYGSGSGPITSYGIVTNPSNGDLVFNTNPGNGRLMTFNQTDGVMNLWNGMKLDTSFIGIDVYDHPLNLSSSFGGMTTMLTAQGNVVVSGSMIASGSSIVTGSMRVTGSISTIGSASVIGSLTALSKTTIELGSDNGIKIGATNGSGEGIDTGNISMQVRNGILSLAPTSFTNTTGSLLHLSSSSSNSFVNLMFKSNNNTVDTIISGSNNIFVNPGAATAGFKRYIGGFANYFGLVPQITGSAGFSPSMANNTINTGILMRIPVSSSTYTMNGNVLNNPGANGVQLGISAGSNFEKAVSGLTFNNNNINGTLGATAYKTPLSSSITITQNNIGGTVSLNMDSSSINLSNTLIQGNLTVNNSYFPSTYTAPNAFFGLNNFINVGSNVIYASGSNTTFPSNRTVAGGSSMLGNANTISASLNGDNAQVQSTHLIGFGLNVLGTNLIQVSSVNDFGSVFVGRNNAIDGNKNKTAETIFAVGTGNTTTRKTGFLIDSGSNTFIEGTLNVSGSTSLTGSLTSNDDITLNGPSSKLELTGIASQIKANNLTGSWGQTNGLAALQLNGGLYANGNLQFNVGAFTSTITQSGSAAVSQSMTFNVTDISEGVTLNGGGTQFILANSGTYNIQFSTQILADTGADDVWIWLKKNGTNVDNSAGRVTLANNEELIAAWNYVVTAAAGDYFELVWESAGGDALLLYNIAAGNYPAVPSVIATITQVR